VIISQVATAYYFLHFLVILPIVSQIEVPKPLPFSITEAVLGKDKAPAEPRAGIADAGTPGALPEGSLQPAE
jgi:ubiquinol-cytochrome c reductase cytochrome b subunit